MSWTTAMAAPSGQPSLSQPTRSGRLAALAMPLSVSASVAGLIVAIQIVGAAANFKDPAGAASALVGSLQLSDGIMGATLVCAFAEGTPRLLAVGVALCGLGSLTCVWLVSGAYASPHLHLPGAWTPKKSDRGTGQMPLLC